VHHSPGSACKGSSVSPCALGGRPAHPNRDLFPLPACLRARGTAAPTNDCAFGDEGPTPLDGAVWGWRNNRAPDGDYEATVALLVAAGAPTRHSPPTGNPHIDALLNDQRSRPSVD